APGDLALIQFSSGTTVEPKPVALTHANVLANVAAIDTYIPEQGPLRQRGVSWLPLYHDMGLIGCLLLAVYHPGPLALLPPEAFLARPALWLRAIARTRATLTVAPNFAFGLCAKRVRDEELQGADLSCLRLVLNGAEPIAPAALRRFCERFARFGFDRRALMPVYGLSEASLAVTFSPPGRGPRTVRRAGRELASVGAPVAGVEVSIRGEDGRELPDGALTEDAVRARVVERTGIRPHTVKLLQPGTIPRTSSGKLRRAETLRQLLGGELRPPRNVTLLRMAREAALSAVALARLRLSR